MHFDSAFHLLDPGVGMAGSAPAHPGGLASFIQPIDVLLAALYYIDIEYALYMEMMGEIWTVL